LKGLTVLDLTTNISGPYTTHILSSLGAKVWKVERPEGDDTRRMAPLVKDQSAYFTVINPFKHSIALDLKSQGGQNIINRLITHADVFVENFRPTVAEKLGLGWKRVHTINPKLIYASISAYGQMGPDRLLPGYDALLQARTGLLSVTGRENQPPVRVGVSILDQSSGFWAALAILVALYDRLNTGRGQYVSTSLFESGIFFMGYHLAYRQLTGRNPVPQGSDHSAFSPYGAFETGRDGNIFIGVSNDRQFERLASSLSHEEWTRNPRYQSNDTRVKHRGELRNQIEDALRTKGPKDWEGILSKANVPVARLQKVDEVLRDPQAKANALFYSVLGSGGRLLVPRIPFSMSTHSLDGRSPRLPRLSESARHILRSVGYSPTEIREFIRSGAVAPSSGNSRRSE
jgi:crotonobetainyl-CoA:carnitine CoA-transferase CaiB-like acyl-CoA transferase